MSGVEPDDRLLKRLAEVRQRLAHLDEQLADPAVLDDHGALGFRVTAEDERNTAVAGNGRGRLAATRRRGRFLGTCKR